MNKLSKFALVSSVLASIVLLYRSLNWRHEYLREIIYNIKNRLIGAEKEFFQRFTRYETRVNLHTAFLHMAYSYDTNLDQLRNDLDQAKSLLESCIKDDPKGKKAYEDCIKFFDELMNDIDERVPDPTISGNLLRNPIKSREINLKWDKEIPKVVTRRLYPSFTYDEFKEILKNGRTSNR